MDLDQLHTFLEIVRLKSFSKAAQSCFRTQPAVSAQVRQLEQELKASLFERLGTKKITLAGHIFAEFAEQILGAATRAGLDQRAGTRAARRTGDRRQRSHLHLRAAAGLLRIQEAFSQRADPGGPFLMVPAWWRRSSRIRRISALPSFPWPRNGCRWSRFTPMKLKL